MGRVSGPSRTVVNRSLVTDHRLRVTAISWHSETFCSRLVDLGVPFPPLLGLVDRWSSLAHLYRPDLART